MIRRPPRYTQYVCRQRQMCIRDSSLSLSLSLQLFFHSLSPSRRLYPKSCSSTAVRLHRPSPARLPRITAKCSFVHGYSSTPRPPRLSLHESPSTTLPPQLSFHLAPRLPLHWLYLHSYPTMIFLAHLSTLYATETHWHRQNH